MRNKFNIRASQVACFAQCSAGYSFTKRLKMLTFLSLIAANILHELNYIKVLIINQEKRRVLSRFFSWSGIIIVVLEGSTCHQLKL